MCPVVFNLVNASTLPRRMHVCYVSLVYSLTVMHQRLSACRQTAQKRRSACLKLVVCTIVTCTVKSKQARRLQAFLLAAMKFHCYVKALPIRAPADSQLAWVAIQQGIDYLCILVRARVRGARSRYALLNSRFTFVHAQCTYKPLVEFWCCSEHCVHHSVIS